MTRRTTSPEFEHIELPGNLRLALNSNQKLKTILIKVYLTTNLDEGVTRRALLPMVLQRGSRSLPDMQALSRYLESLYGAGLYSSVMKVGEWHVLKFQLEVVNERFLPGETGLFRRALEFLHDLLFDPLVVNGGFRADYLDQEKQNLRRIIDSLVDEKAAYAAHRCIEEMCRQEPFRLHEQGRVEDLEGVNAENLYQDYRDLFDLFPLAVYVTGDIDIDATRDVLTGVFTEARRGTTELSPVPAPVRVEAVREVEERMDVNQGKLVLGFRHGVTYGGDDYEALLLMNGILGQGSHSKLFQNVREKASMAYYAHSSLERTKGLLFICSGIAVDNYRDALRIILEQVEAMRQGNFSAEEMDATVRTIINQNLMLEDNFSALAEADFVRSLHGCSLDLPTFRKKLEQVPRGAIVEVARKLQHDTTYFLRS